MSFEPTKAQLLKLDQIGGEYQFVGTSRAGERNPHNGVIETIHGMVCDIMDKATGKRWTRAFAPSTDAHSEALDAALALTDDTPRPDGSALSPAQIAALIADRDKLKAELEKTKNEAKPTKTETVKTAK